VGGNVEVSGQVNVLGNVVARTFRGNVIGNLSGVFANVTSIGAGNGHISGSLSIGVIGDPTGNLSVEGTIIPKRGIRYSGANYVDYLIEFGDDTIPERRSGVGMNDFTMRLYAASDVPGAAIIIGGTYSPSAAPVATDFMSFDQSYGNIRVFKDTTFQALDGSDCNVSVRGQVSANNIQVSGQVSANNIQVDDIQVSGQIETLGNVFSQYYFGNVAFASGFDEAG
jgi:hypothetical protein